jgi:hypothetical protein
VTEEQRSRRPIFIATLRAARLLAGCFVAHRSKTTAGILPLRFAHPAKIRSSATTPVTDLVHQIVAEGATLPSSRLGRQTFQASHGVLQNSKMRGNALDLHVNNAVLAQGQQRRSNLSFAVSGKLFESRLA